MKQAVLILLLIFSFSAKGQYTKEKLRDILCGTNEKLWQVTSVNTDRPEKTITFKINNTADIGTQDGKKSSLKWSLQTADNIRWFIDMGKKYELIVSYNKKGDQYIKLTYHGADEHELKLTQK